jgi:DNA-binding NarL/FixJ family response regulator
MTDLQSDRDKLRESVRTARDEYLQISDALDRLAREAPSMEGMAGSDGLQTIVNLGKRRAAAFQRYLNALTLLHGNSAATVRSRRAISEKPDLLTPREREVLTLIAAGKSSRQVAAELGITFRTAVCHRYHLQSKLGIHNTASLTLAAVRMGLIRP